MSTQVATSTSVSATAPANQRRVDRCANGVLWMAYIDSTTAALLFCFSTDNGVTWTQIADTLPYHSANASFFIDQDDFAHVVLKNSVDGFLYYVRGTPNAGRTSWTWSAGQAFYNADGNGNYPDVVAFRDPADPTAWKAHIVFSYADASNNYASYKRFGISSAGAFTYEVGLLTNVQTVLGGSYGVASTHTMPSIDFQHNGDGKTPVTNPALFAGWSAGAAGVGKGLRFRKAPYSAGWTWGTEREIDNTVYTRDFTLGYWGVCCLFDGTRVLLGGLLFNGNATVTLYERDLADTTSTQRIFVSEAGGASTFCDYGSMTYDANGNVYLVGSNAGGASTRVVYYRYLRAANTYARFTTPDTAGSNLVYASTKRGAANGQIEYIFLDGTASPYNVRYGTFSAVSSEVTTGSGSSQTAYSNQRKVDRTSNGVIWMVYEPFGASPSAAFIAFSTDNGATWTFDTDIPNGSGSTTATYTRNVSFFIDQDDFAHLVFKDNSNGGIYYRRGTPNAGRTAWTWSAPQVYWTTDANMDLPDVVAFRNPAGGGGWVALVVASFVSGTGAQPDTGQFTITSGGVISAVSRGALGANYGTGQPQFPSIDFQHTGDGKTPVASPALFMAWSAGATGAGKGIRYRKATYSAGVWTLGTEVEIDNTVYWDTTHCGCGLFDGTQFVLGGNATTGASIVTRIWQVTTAGVVSTLYNAATSATVGAYYSSLTYDDKQNVYVVGVDSSVTHVNLLKYTRIGGAVTTTVPASASGTPYFSMKRGYSGGRISWIYMHQTASPFPIRYDAQLLPVTSTVRGIVMVV